MGASGGGSLGDLERLLVALERSCGDQVGRKRSPKARKQRRLTELIVEDVLDPQNIGKSWILGAQKEPSETKTGTEIYLMLKMSYGVEILRFLIEFNDFSNF